MNSNLKARKAKLLKATNAVSTARYEGSDLVLMLERLEGEMDAGAWRASMLDDAIDHAEQMRQTLLRARLSMTYMTDDGEE